MDSFRVVMPGRIPRPRPAPAAEPALTRARDHQQQLDRTIERELRRIRAERSADDNYDAYEEAKSLLAQHGGNFDAAMAEVLRRYGHSHTNGHRPDSALRADPTHIEYSPHEGQVLGVR
jgi:hypothetical protein